jgi:peptidoglycan LD-endopeptidase CwlK
LGDLRPATRTKAEAFLRACDANPWLQRTGIDVIVTCTWRSNEEQAVLYAIGRTKPGRRVTNAKPGQSAHNDTHEGRPWSRAFDVVPLRAGKPVWGTQGDGIDADDRDDQRDDLEIWQRVGAIGESVGLQWAGRWTSFREFPHFQDK